MNLAVDFRRTDGAITVTELKAWMALRGVTDAHKRVVHDGLTVQLMAQVRACTVHHGDDTSEATHAYHGVDFSNDFFISHVDNSAELKRLFYGRWFITD